MTLELLLKDLKDFAVRENFQRIRDLFSDLKLLDGDWYFFDVDLPQSGLNKIKHKLTFTPKDIIFLSALGNQSFYFKYQSFDSEHIYVHTTGPVRIRFFAGVLTEGVYGQATANGRASAASYPYSPAGITKRAIIDFGSTPVAAKLFNVVDADISETSIVSAQVAYAATTQDADEAELTPLNLICQPKNGSVDIYANTSEGRAYGQFAVNYRVG